MHPQLRLFTLQLFLDFCAIFFPEWPLIFLVVTIHQVIWPSPGTLGAEGMKANFAALGVSHREKLAPSLSVVLWEQGTGTGNP